MKILVTAGPTREPIDPVRYLTNRSSGKMGYAIAAAAAAHGCKVTLVSGPTILPCPENVQRVDVETAQEMYEAVSLEINHADACIMAAAVADFRPVVAASHKIKKEGATFTLDLEHTHDILAAARPEFEYRGVLVGFAAETDDLIANALEKVRRKQCDFIVANDVGKPLIGFDSDDNEAAFVYPDGRTEYHDRMSKRELAEKLIGVVLELVKKSRP